MNRIYYLGLLLVFVFLSGCLGSGQDDIIIGKVADIINNFFQTTNQTIYTNFTQYANTTNNVTNITYNNVTSSISNETVDFHHGNASNLSNPINISVLPFDICTSSPQQWSWWDGARLNCYTYSDDDSSYHTIAAYNIDYNAQQTNNTEQETKINTANNTANNANATANSKLTNVSAGSNISISWNNGVAQINNTNPGCTDCPNSTVATKEATWDAKLYAAVVSPLLDQILSWNGANWVNTNMTSSMSAGAGVIWFLDSLASNVSGYESLSISPNLTAEDIEYATVNNNQTLIDAYITNSTGIGLTSISGGIWQFHNYANVSLLGTGVSEIIISTYKGNLTGGNQTLLFNVTTGNITDVSDAGLYEIVSVQPTFSINTTDRIIVKYIAKTTNLVNTAIYIHHGGNAHYTHIHTPLTTSHNDLALKQGGDGTNFYHLGNDSYNNVTANYTIWNTVTTKEPAIVGSTGNTFWNGLKNWITLGIGNITSLQGVLDALNATDNNLAINDTTDRAYVNTTFLKVANISSCTGTDKLTTADGKILTCATDQTGSGGSPTAEATYRFISNGVTMLSNATIMDVFNAAGSGKVLRITEIKAYVNDTAAVTGIFAPLEITRTSTVGTGGTVISAGLFDSADAALPAQVTSRTAPSGGALKTGNNLSGTRISTEEASVNTGAMGTFPWVGSDVNLYINSGNTPRQRITLAEGEGIRCSWGVVVGVAAGQVSCLVEVQTGAAYANELPTYSWQASTDGAANKRMMDIFNAVGSGKVLKITRIVIYSSPLAAVTGQVIPFTVFRTSSNGTGGYLIPEDKYNSSNIPLSSTITARNAPTGGTTITGGGIIYGVIGTDETAYGEFGGFDMVSRGSNTQYSWESTTTQRPLTVRAGEGIMVRTSALADTANVKIIVEGTVV